MTRKTIITFFLTIAVYSTMPAFAQQPNKSDSNKSIVGQWINTSNKTKGGVEYYGLKCKDTIQYLQNGKYTWKQCGINETGSWKITKDKKKIILYQRKSKYWEDYLKNKDIGQMDIPIVSMTKQDLVTIIYDEEEGAINRYYSRIK